MAVSRRCARPAARTASDPGLPQKRSPGMTMETGEVIATGTPELLKPGDVVEA
jgi:hypothetical protein